MDYQAEVDHLDALMLKWKLRRDAQEKGNDLYEKFQVEITALARLQGAWEEAIPHLEAADVRIREARLVVSEAQKREDQVAGRPIRAAGWLGAPGAGVVVVGLAWSAPWWLIVAGVMLVGVGLVLLMRGLGAQREAAKAVDSAYAALQVLNAQRDALIPGRQTGNGQVVGQLTAS